MKRFTIDLPDALHEAFSRKCFLAKPKVSMKERIIEFIARDVGQPVPKIVDRRKLTMDERTKLQIADAKRKSRA